MKKRLFIILSDSILLIFLGLVYAWSVFKKPLSLAYGWNDSQLTWTFTICMFMFCLGGFGGAQLSKRFSHRLITQICGGLIGFSFVLMGFMTSLWQIYVLYGVIIGFAVGIVYNCVLSTGNRWFPDKAGLIAGLLLMFFGAGSLILSPFSNLLLSKLGTRIAFVVIGILFAAVLILGGLNVRVPSEDESKTLLGEVKTNTNKTASSSRDYEPKEMMKTANFWIYFVWCILVSAIGLALLGQIATVSASVGMKDTACALMVSLFAVFNGVGRFFFGSFYDKKGRGLTMTIFGILFILGGILMILGVKLGSALPIVLSLVLFGIAYGGVTPTNANFARSFFGNKNYATNFSLVNFNLLVAVFLGQFVGSTLYVRSGGYLYTAIAITVIAVLSLILQFCVKDNKQNIDA